MTAAKEERAAPLVRRLAAALIDAAAIVMLALAGRLVAGQTTTALFAPGTLVLAAAAAMFYRMLTEGTPLMATPGKRLMGLRVQPPPSGRLDFAVAALRAWPWWLTGALAGIDPRLVLPGALLSLAALVPIPLSTDRRGLHDRMAGTRVIRDDAGATGRVKHE